MHENLPFVPLRGLVVLPGEMLHFDAGREKSVAAIQYAVKENSGLLLVSSQKDAKKNEVTFDDVYKLGTLCRVRQVICLPGDSVRVMVEGISRAIAIECSGVSPFFRVTALTVADKPYDEVTAEAIRRRMSAAFLEFCANSKKLAQPAIDVIQARPELGAYTDAVANTIMTKTEDRQAVLEASDPADRATRVLKHLLAELEIQKIDKRISAEVKKQVDRNQKEYYLREQMRAIRKELGEDEQSEADGYRDRLAKKQLPDEVRERLNKEIDRFSELPAGSHEAPVAQNYIECVLDLPYAEATSDNLDVKNARRILDEDHYGLDKVKERIVEHIAVSRLTGSLSGQIICFVGPPGVGKTSISSSIARALGRKFVRMSLGGVRDEAEIRGHRRTYIGAMPGRMIAAMRQAGTVNPVILFDEIDKLGSDWRGDPSSAMLEVLDGAQNFAFRDHFLELPYDLSRVMFITTANDMGSIPRPLLDRMEIIEVPSYLETEKIEIAARHLVPKQLKENGLKKSMLAIPEALLPDIIEGYTAEAGVRELERTIGAICRKAACEIGAGKARVRLTKQRLTEYLGAPKFLETAMEKEDAVGMANGLAWTAVGGQTLEVEAQMLPGTGQVLATGKLGDVMQESAKAALTFVRANADALGIDEDFLSRTDVHVHVPEGAVPKDGPSAGITIMTAMVSALTHTPVRAGVAMTGEITLRGRVLPIGGLREKLLAAVRAGAHTVIVPKANDKDVREVPEEITGKLNIVYADNAVKVLDTALTQKSAVLHELHAAAMNKPPMPAVQ